VEQPQPVSGDSSGVPILPHHNIEVVTTPHIRIEFKKNALPHTPFNTLDSKNYSVLLSASYSIIGDSFTCPGRRNNEAVDYNQVPLSCVTKVCLSHV
jgi:hypothetical protein